MTALTLISKKREGKEGKIREKGPGNPKRRGDHRRINL